MAIFVTTVLLTIAITVAAWWRTASRVSAVLEGFALDLRVPRLRYFEAGKMVTLVTVHDGYQTDWYYTVHIHDPLYAEALADTRRCRHLAKQAQAAEPRDFRPCLVEGRLRPEDRHALMLRVERGLSILRLPHQVTLKPHRVVGEGYIVRFQQILREVAAVHYYESESYLKLEAEWGKSDLGVCIRRNQRAEAIGTQADWKALAQQCGESEPPGFSPLLRPGSPVAGSTEELATRIGHALSTLGIEHKCFVR